MMNLNRQFVGILLLALIGAEGMHAASLVSKDLIKNKQHTHFRVSPDGSKIALLAPHEGAMNIWHQGVGRGKRTLITRESRSLTHFLWQYDNEHLLYLQDQDGDQQHHLYQVDINGFNTRDLTPYRGIQARVVSMLPLVPDQILVSMNLNSRQRHDVFRINLDTGAIELDTINPGYVIQWAADADLQTRAGVTLSPGGDYEILIKNLANGEWTPKVTIPAGRAIPGLIGFSPDGSVLWYLGDDETGSIRQWALNLQTGETASTPEGKVGDVVDVFRDPVLGVPEGVALRNPMKSWRMFHGGYESIIEFLRFEKGDLFFPSRSLQKKEWIVGYTDPQMSTTYQVYVLGDRHKVILMGMERPNLRNGNFSATQPLLIPGPDGQKIRATLNRPILKKEEPVPTVIRVVDGAMDQPTFQFDEEAQWLAYKEMAVLTIYPPRGVASKEAVTALADDHWATGLKDDILVARNWAIAEGHAKDDQIYLNGTGLGAYAALSAGVKQPDAFAGLVLVNGVTDVPSFMKELPTYEQSIASKLAGWFTGDTSGQKAWAEPSPLDHLNDLDSPVLLVHGANNPWIRKDQAGRLRSKLLNLQKPVETLLIEGEGHQIIQENNVIRYYEALEKFLSAR
jgi:alpha-beta hydrolase superfamily lysophospholipase